MCTSPNNHSSAALSMTCRTVYAKHGKLLFFTFGLAVGLILNFVCHISDSSVSAAPPIANDVNIGVSAGSLDKFEDLPSIEPHKIVAQQHALSVNAREKFPYSSPEDNYMNSMRSCFGAFCFDDPVAITSGGRSPRPPVTRVGVLMPEFAASTSSPEALMKLFRKAGLPASDKLEVVFDTNVPPYGYGKNHGWSRIIRIAARTAPSAYALLSKKFSEDPNSIKQLFDPQVCEFMVFGYTVKWQWTVSRLIIDSRIYLQFDELL